MKFLNHFKILAIIALASCISNQGYSQSISNPGSDLQFYNNLKAIYGLDQVLVNGIYYDNIYRNDLGTPFLFNKNFVDGHIVLHGIKYENLKLKYNAFNQTIVLELTYHNENQLVFLPPVDFITEFKINLLTFRKYNFTDLDPKFYQEVYDGDIKCLYFWQIKREESHHNGRYSAYQFFKPKRKSFLVVDNNLYSYGSKGGFLKILPKKHKKEIAAFIKKNKIRVNKSTDEEIAKLIEFCESKLKEEEPSPLAEYHNK